MRHLLLIQTANKDNLAPSLATLQAEKPETHAVIVNLDQPDPDYQSLLEKIFQADSIQVY